MCRRKQTFLEAIDFAEVSSYKDAKLLSDAKYGKLDGGRMSKEQYGCEAYDLRCLGAWLDMWPAARMQNGAVSLLMCPYAAASHAHSQCMTEFQWFKRVMISLALQWSAEQCQPSWPLTHKHWDTAAGH